MSYWIQIDSEGRPARCCGSPALFTLHCHIVLLWSCTRSKNLDINGWVRWCELLLFLMLHFNCIKHKLNGYKHPARVYWRSEPLLWATPLGLPPAFELKRFAVRLCGKVVVGVSRALKAIKWVLECNLVWDVTEFRNFKIQNVLILDVTDSSR